MADIIDFFVFQSHRDEFFLFSTSLPGLDITGLENSCPYVHAVQRLGHFCFMIKTNGGKRESFLAGLRSYLDRLVDHTLSEFPTIHSVIEFLSQVPENGETREHFEQPDLFQKP